MYNFFLWDVTVFINILWEFQKTQWQQEPQREIWMKCLTSHVRAVVVFWETPYKCVFVSPNIFIIVVKRNKRPQWRIVIIWNVLSIILPQKESALYGLSCLYDLNESLNKRESIQRNIKKKIAYILSITFLKKLIPQHINIPTFFFNKN